MNYTSETLENSVEWDSISYIISSRYRIAVLDRLASGPATPSLIADHADDHMAHISRAIGELRDESLVELLVSEDRRKGRVYGMTEQAQASWQVIEEQDLLDRRYQ